MRASLPPPLHAAVEDALAGAGIPGRVARVAEIGGGCINRATRVETDRGDRFFLKWNPSAPAGLFGSEAEGLRALGAAGALRVPGVIAFAEAAKEVPAWLLLEYVEPGAEGRGYATRLGEGLAALHRAGAPSAAGSSEAWGWPGDGFIGSLPQDNEPTGAWGTFWRDRRLAPQLRLARDRGHFRGEPGRRMDRVLDRCTDLLAPAEDEGPSLLHGDLWGGNVFAGPGGAPVLVDPAAYRGHREVDLAMSELFGGFPAAWPDAYYEAWPLDPAYHHHRRGMYQLYYLLVHVNLFGGSYEAGSLRAAREALRGE